MGLYVSSTRKKRLTTYLDFNGKAGRKGIFHRFSFETGFASGLISFQFDPDYSRNGRIYTIHMEDQSGRKSAVPDSSSFPGFNTKGYEVTSAFLTPGPSNREAVVVEWTDTNNSNTTFEGTAREVMRVQHGRVHPMGDMIFNPAARPGDPDWRVL
jgi:hypothetical protein